MFTPRRISDVLKGVLKTMAIFAVMIAVRSPATVKNLVQPFCHYVASFISEATDENAGKRVTKTQLDRGSAQSRPVIDLDSLHLPTQQTKAQSGPTTSASQETGEDPSNSNATTLQPQATNLSTDPIKFASAEFNDRFHAGIIVPAASPKPIGDVSVGLTSEAPQE